MKLKGFRYFMSENQKKLKGAIDVRRDCKDVVHCTDNAGTSGGAGGAAPGSNGRGGGGGGAAVDPALASVVASLPTVAGAGAAAAGSDAAWPAAVEVEMQFQIVTAERTYYIYAENGDAAEKWVAALRRSLRRRKKKGAGSKKLLSVWGTEPLYHRYFFKSGGPLWVVLPHRPSRNGCFTKCTTITSAVISAR